MFFVTAGLAACNTETTSEDTCGETAATVDAPTETPTETLTEAPTEVVTVPSTEAPTKEVTEPETEGETVPDTGYPVDKMTIGGVDIHSFTLVVQNVDWAEPRSRQTALYDRREGVSGCAYGSSPLAFQESRCRVHFGFAERRFRRKLPV